MDRDESIRAAVLMLLGKVDEDTLFSDQEVATLDEARHALSAPCACGGRVPIKQWPDILRRYPGGAENLIGSFRKQKPGDVLVDVLLLPAEEQPSDAS